MANTPLVITFDSQTGAGDKTYEEVIAAFKSGKAVIGQSEETWGSKRGSVYYYAIDRYQGEDTYVFQSNMFSVLSTQDLSSNVQLYMD